MGYIKELGYNIFRCRAARENQEFIVQNIDTRRFNQYSEKRAKEILVAEVERSKKYNIRKFIQDVLPDLTEKKFSVKKIIENWFDTEYEIVDGLGYMPTNKITYQEKDSVLFNRYFPPKITPYAGDWSDIEALLLNICGSDTAASEYFMKWLAWIVQHPLQRLPTSIVLQGEPGTGKTKFCELVLGRIFGENFTEINQTDVDSPFNSYMQEKQLILADEVVHRENKLLMSNKLKTFVTNEYVSVRRLYTDPVYQKNYTHWIFCSNNLEAIRIENKDRRYSVFKSRTLKNGFEVVQGILENPDQVNHFYHFLLSVPVEFEEVARPMHTVARENLISLGKNSIEHFVDTVRECGGMYNYSQELKDDWKIHLDLIKKGDSYFVKTNEAYKLYCNFCLLTGFKNQFTQHKFSRMLSYVGYEPKVIRHGDETVRAICDIPENTLEVMTNE